MWVYALAFVLCIPTIYSQDGCDNTTPFPDQQPCIRDIIIAIDGTPYMKNSTYVLLEIDFIDQMISNWSFGDNGVNVAFMTYGFKGQFGSTQFYDNLPEAKSVLNTFRSGANGELKPTFLQSMVKFVESLYTTVYLPRPGIEPRLIVFTATTNVTDIAKAAPYFLNLYNKNYDNVINVIFADPQLYSGIKALKAIDMKEFLPQFFQNITETIWDTLCTHDIRFTPQPCTTTTTTLPPPTTSTTPAMTTTTTLLPTTTTTTIAPGTVSPSGPNGGSGDCRCIPRHLWLDIVVIMDVSQSIRKEGLDQLRAHIITLFGEYMTIDPLQNQSVRVGIVSVANTAKIEADFNDIKSLDDLETFIYAVPLRATENAINIEEGFQKSSDILEVEGSHRNNTRKVIILYTSAFRIDGFNDPRPAARTLLSSGVHIIGVKYNIFHEAGFIDDLSTITSPNMTFSNNFTLNPFDGAQLLNVTVEALCWINCFCINNWNERKNPFTTLPKYGQCLFAADIDSGWTPAALSCSDMIKDKKPSMSFAKNKEKFDYFIDMFSNLTSHTGKLYFHVGIHFNQSLSAYQYTDGSLVSREDYVPWNTADGYPKVSKGTCVAALQGRGFSINYSNVDCYNSFARYICEVIPCDTENYCARIDIK